MNTKYLNDKTQKVRIEQLKMMSYYIMKMTSIAFYKPENITIIETFLFLKYCNYQMYEISSSLFIKLECYFTTIITEKRNLFWI